MSPTTDILLPPQEALNHEEANEYYKQLLVRIQSEAAEVRLDSGDGKGKGVFATRDVAEGDTLWSEAPLASLQHTTNRGSARACNSCLMHLGSVEQQVGHKLHHLVEDLKRSAQPQEAQEEDSDSADGSVDLDAALEAGQRLEEVYSHVTPERIADLRAGAVQLPLSERFQLASPVPCRRGCGHEYCSPACEEAAWSGWHCLMCTSGTAASGAEAGAGATAAGAGGSGSCGAHGSGAGPSSCGASGSNSGGQQLQEQGGQVEEMGGVTVDRTAMAAFAEHALQTNEIFLLAAKVVCGTLLRAVRLLGASQQQQQQSEGPGCSAAGAGGSSAEEGSAGDGAAGSRISAALQAAWQPYLYGWKRPWWEAVAVPDDVEDEDEFRGQLRSLASDSLELLSAAIRHPELAPHLLQLQVYGSIVGMFELNNLGVSVPTPVEDYFLAVDELQGQQREQVMQVTQPLLDALDAEYATPCEATAFLALQSCVNHSCNPNAAATCDQGDNTVAIVARRDIRAGEEVTLSYIDEGLPYKQRQAELRDYGFVCRCDTCIADAAAAKARRQGAAKGMKVGKRR